MNNCYYVIQKMVKVLKLYLGNDFWTAKTEMELLQIYNKYRATKILSVVLKVSQFLKLSQNKQ